MKRLTLAAACALSIIAAPASAQTVESETLTDEQYEALGNLFGDMFGDAEPLSQEEQERVPSAMMVVSKLMPEGTMARMMEESMQPMMESMIGGMGAGPALSVSQLTGLGPFELSEIDPSKLDEAAKLLDPAAEDRNKAMGSAMFGIVAEVMADVEPAYRAGLARAYAVRFTKAELDDLSAYFDTPVGKKYAAESYLIFADPQVMASMNEMMPAVMQRMPEMMTVTQQLETEFPKGRTFSDLSAEEQTRLSELLGVSKEDLKASEPATSQDATEAVEPA